MTGSAKVWHESRGGSPVIGGERRGDRRYGMQLDVRWKLLHRRRVLDSGLGRTRDLSSHGALLDIDRLLPAGSHLQVAIAWPALLHGVSPLKLVAAGRVVRSDGTCTAIRMTQHEFRTAGASPDHPKALAAASAPIPIWNVRGSADMVKLQ
jgi:hypothetical protein